jgi:hypothetical protein
MYATLLMDVEDIVTPESDDVAGECAEIMAQEGAIATLCVVGEKGRLLEQRGRADVIAALNLHDIGVHTDLHSVHPTILEFLQGLRWEDGVAEAVRREEPGVRAIQHVFGVTPSCWGGPGNTWGPQINEAMRQLGVPAMIYAHTMAPDEGPHRFAGLLAYPEGPHFGDEWYGDEVRTPMHLAQLCQDLQADAERGILWRQIFLGHPTRLLHEEFWDGPNFAYGANPARTEWISPRRKSQVDVDRVLTDFRRVIRTLRSIPAVELCTIREMNARLERMRFAPLSPAESASVWPVIERKLDSMAGWPILPHHMDLSSVVAMTKRLMPTLEQRERSSE